MCVLQRECHLSAVCWQWHIPGARQVRDHVPGFFFKNDPKCETKYDITDEGTVDEYLGVKLETQPDGQIKLSQPHLIQQIIDDMGFRENSTTKDTPALSTQVLQRDNNGKPFDEAWEYQSIIGKLNFLEKSTCLDLAYSVHQCARFSINPKKSHT